MFANDFLIAEIHRDARAIAIATSEFFGGSGGPISADEANGNHATASARRLAFRCGKD